MVSEFMRWREPFDIGQEDPLTPDWDGAPAERAEVRRGAEGELNQEMGALGNKLGSFLFCVPHLRLLARGPGGRDGAPPRARLSAAPWFVLGPSGPSGSVGCLGLRAGSPRDALRSAGWHT